MDGLIGERDITPKPRIIKIVVFSPFLSIDISLFHHLTPSLSRSIFLFSQSLFRFSSIGRRNKETRNKAQKNDDDEISSRRPDVEPPCRSLWGIYFLPYPSLLFSLFFLPLSFFSTASLLFFLVQPLQERIVVRVSSLIGVPSAKISATAVHFDNGS
ncbi:hypothetical protein ABFS82_10G122000 [Erythranthe guttata]